MDDLFSIKGKIALITGGSRGIGEMIAEAYVAAGAKVIIASRKADELNATGQRLGCTAIVADLSTNAGVGALADAVRGETDRLDILVNNAGATWGAPVDDFPELGWDRVMDLNVKSMFFLTQALLPHLRAAASSTNPTRIINISSINAMRNSRMGNFSYSTSKAAVLGLNQHLAATLAPEHILVNAIAPGFFASRMTDFMIDGPERRAKAEAYVPLGRWGTMEDMGGTAIFLASRASAFMTGTCLVLDGGAVAAA